MKRTSNIQNIEIANVYQWMNVNRFSKQTWSILAKQLGVPASVVCSYYQKTWKRGFQMHASMHRIQVRNIMRKVFSIDKMIGPIIQEVKRQFLLLNPGANILDEYVDPMVHRAYFALAKKTMLEQFGKPKADFTIMCSDGPSTMLDTDDNEREQPELE